MKHYSLAILAVVICLAGCGSSALSSSTPVHIGVTGN